MTAPRALCAALVAALLAPACNEGDVTDEPRQCKEAGWYEGLVIAVRGDRTPLPQGIYWFTITADGLDASVSALIDDNRIACAVNMVDCSREVPAGTDRVLLATVDPADPTEFSVHLEYAGPAGSGGPAEVAIEVFRDDTPVGGAELAPVYRVSMPNGWGCGIATRAVAEVSVAP